MFTNLKLFHKKTTAGPLNSKTLSLDFKPKACLLYFIFTFKNKNNTLLVRACKRKVHLFN